MENKNTKRKLIDITKKMLLDGIQVEKMTARLISSEAETNLAMINYCFKSKDELLKVAVDEIIKEEFNKISDLDDSKLTGKMKLKKIIKNIGMVMVKYRNLTKGSIPYLMLNEEFKLPLDILPFVHDYFGENKSDKECRFIAFQIVYMLQLILYRLEDFYKYSGIDISNSKELDELIELQLKTVGIV